MSLNTEKALLLIYKELKSINENLEKLVRFQLEQAMESKMIQNAFMSLLNPIMNKPSTSTNDEGGDETK